VVAVAVRNVRRFIVGSPAGSNGPDRARSDRRRAPS